MRAFTIWYTISLTVSLSSFPSGALCKTSRSVYCMSSNTMNTCGSLLFFLVVLVVFWEKLVSSLMMFGWPCRSLSRETSLSAILCAYYDKLRVKVIRLNKKIFLQEIWNSHQNSDGKRKHPRPSVWGISLLPKWVDIESANLHMSHYLWTVWSLPSGQWTSEEPSKQYRTHYKVA